MAGQPYWLTRTLNQEVYVLFRQNIFPVSAPTHAAASRTGCFCAHNDAPSGGFDYPIIADEKYLKAIFDYVRQWLFHKFNSSI